MANLIPPSVKIRIIREYRIRVATVWIFLLAAACAVVAALMVPTYFLVTAQYEAVLNERGTIESKKELYESGRKEMEAADGLAAYLEKNTTGRNVIELTAAVDALAGKNVIVRSYQYGTDEKGSPSLRITGVAGNRAMLTNFKDVLESSGRFTAVELPISSLAGDRDIAFSMTAYLEKQ